MDVAASNTALLLLAVGSGWVGNLLPAGIRADIERSRALQIALAAAMIATSFTWASDDRSLTSIARDTALTLGWFLAMDSFRTDQFVLVASLLVGSAFAKRAARAKGTSHPASLAKAGRMASLAAGVLTMVFVVQNGL